MILEGSQPGVIVAIFATVSCLSMVITNHGECLKFPSNIIRARFRAVQPV